MVIAKKINKHSEELYPPICLTNPTLLIRCQTVCRDLFQKQGELQRLCINCYVASQEVQADSPNFLDRKDTRFKKLHDTCVAIFHVGTVKKSARAFPPEDEKKPTGDWCSEHNISRWAP